MLSALFGGRRSPGDSTAPRMRWPREHNEDDRAKIARAKGRARGIHRAALNSRLPPTRECPEVHVCTSPLSRGCRLSERGLFLGWRASALPVVGSRPESEKGRRRGTDCTLSRRAPRLWVKSRPTGTRPMHREQRAGRQTGTGGLLTGSIALPGAGGSGEGGGDPRFGTRGFTERLVALPSAIPTNFHQIIAPCRCSCPARNEVRGNPRSRVRISPSPLPPLPRVETSEADRRERNRGIRVGFSGKKQDLYRQPPVNWCNLDGYVNDARGLTRDRRVRSG